MNKAENIVRKNLILRLYAIGHLDDDDLRDKERYFTKLKKLSENVELGLQINSMFVVDYRSDLLTQADRLKKRKQFEQSEMLYATFFEHNINSIVEILCKRKRLSQEAATNIFRKLSFEDKASWLLELLGAPAFSKRYLRMIIELLNRRNSFVHYKYKATHDERRATFDDQDKINVNFTKIERAIKYTLKYDAIVCFNNKFKDIDNIVKYLYS